MRTDTRSRGYSRLCHADSEHATSGLVTRRLMPIHTMALAGLIGPWFAAPCRRRVLVLGCGDSAFSSDLYEAGLARDVTNVDISEACVRCKARMKLGVGADVVVPGYPLGMVPCMTFFKRAE